MSESYWEDRWQNGQMGWNIGYPSPPLVEFIDSIQNKDAAILIPGCGNAYEAEYLMEKGFSNVTVLDIAPTAVKNLQEKFSDNPNIKVVLQDFFEHKSQYDFILEQTFFCALDPSFRAKYVAKMHTLLKKNGVLAGLLFNIDFEKAGSPFGGNKKAYNLLFSEYFEILEFTECSNSIPERAGTELFFEAKKA